MISPVRFCGVSLAESLFPSLLSDFRQRLVSNEDRLPYFLLGLRLFPASPNWAINVACGVLGVPLTAFFPTALLGLLPYNYLCVQAGVMLSSIRGMSDVFSTATMLQMTAMAAAATLPGIMLRTRRGGESSSQSNSGGIKE